MAAATGIFSNKAVSHERVPRGGWVLRFASSTAVFSESSMKPPIHVR